MSWRIYKLYGKCGGCKWRRECSICILPATAKCTRFFNHLIFVVHLPNVVNYNFQSIILTVEILRRNDCANSAPSLPATATPKATTMTTNLFHFIHFSVILFTRQSNMCLARSWFLLRENFTIIFPSIHTAQAHRNRFCWFRSFRLTTIAIDVHTVSTVCVWVPCRRSSSIAFFFLPNFSPTEKSAKRFIIYLKDERIIFWCIYVLHIHAQLCTSQQAAESSSFELMFDDPLKRKNRWKKNGMPEDYVEK